MPEADIDLLFFINFAIHFLVFFLGNIASNVSTYYHILGTSKCVGVGVLLRINTKTIRTNKILMFLDRKKVV